MGKWLRRLFAPEAVEVDLSRPRLDADGRSALETLYGHPGLNYLTTRLRLTRWHLESMLRTGNFATTREFDQVQLGIRWVYWLERHIEEVTDPKPRRKTELTTEELDVFAKADAALELVGQGK